MKRSGRRDAQELVRTLRKLGLTVERTRGQHWRVNTQEGPVFMPSTPSDGRSLRNVVAKLRQKGVEL